MATKRTTTKRPAAKKAVARKRPVDPALRQLALQHAVTVSGIDYSIGSAGAWGGTGAVPSMQRPRHETPTKIIATANQFLAFLTGEAA